jgi:flagellar protein FlaJ
MMIMLVVSIGLILLGIALGDAAILGNLIVISSFLVAVPYFFFKYSKYVWVKSLEVEFPNFVRDLADSIRSMPLPEALSVISKSNYGNLTQEIKKIHNRMSWGTPFLRTLEIFKINVKESRIISEALSILRQSYESGGSMVSTLESISRDLLMLREAEQERSSMLRQHIMIMYAIFFMFVGISLLIIYVMVPMIETQSQMGTGFQTGAQMVFTNPCPAESSFLFPCGLYMAIATMFGLSFENIGSYYVALFFSAVMMQGLFIGLITGQLGENSIIAGLKHSLIMLIVTTTIFLFISRAGIMPL